MRDYSIKYHINILAVLILIITSCTAPNDKGGTIIVRVGDKELTKAQLQAQYTALGNYSDSVATVHRLIHDWIQQELITEIAAKNIYDLKRIDKLVDEYRNSLITHEYMKQMIATKDSEIGFVSEDSIADFYSKHKDSFQLTSPIIKGIYIKIPNKAPQLEDLKKWVKRGSSQDMEKIEKYTVSHRMHYEYFTDQWVEWSQIENAIPYDFGVSNTFVSKNPFFTFHDNENTHILKITEYRQKGEIMPIDFAKSRIKEIFVNANQIAFERNLHTSLYNDALESGELVIFDKTFNNSNKTK